MHIEKYIRKIVDEGSRQEMEELSNILQELMMLLHEYDEQKYKKYEMCLYKMAYGEVLNEDMAEDIVNRMQPYGEKWTMNQTNQIQHDYGYDSINPVDFYIVINSAYNDYRDVFGDDLETYVKFANAFINDEDAKKGKVFLYYTNIPR